MGTILGTDDPNARTLADMMAEAVGRSLFIRRIRPAPYIRKGAPPRQREKALARLAELTAAGVDLNNEKREVIFRAARDKGYRGSLRTLMRAQGRK